MEKIQFVGTTPTELIDLLDERQKKRFDELKQHLQTKEIPKYLTRKQVSKMLSVDISSIHNYTVKGILQSHQIGGRILYLLSEVESSIIKLNK